jgi:SAM-dependent methyltransferase
MTSANPVSPNQTGSSLELGIFLASFAVLFLELLLTRIFSVTMFHHFAFFAVALAMTGLGAGGLALTVLPERFPRERLPVLAGVSALVFALATVLVVSLAFHLPVTLQLREAGFRNALLVFAAAVVPFVAAGLILALLLTHHPQRVSRLYGWDLLGAAAACAVVAPALTLLGAPTAVLVAAAVGALSGAVLAHRAAQVRRACLLVAGLLALLAGANAVWGFYDVRVAKGRPQFATLVTRWNAYSRVEVNGTPEDLVTPMPPFGFGYSSTLPEVTTREVFLRYDADALTQITGFDGDLEQVAYLGYDVTSAPYHMRRFERVLVLGAGGGRDVLTALALGSSGITAVEVNPLTIALLRGRFAGFTGGLYTNHTEVEVVRDDGRNFVRRAGERYELIQASLVDTWAASAAGAYALVDNNLYTVEAFREYLGRLTDDGVMAFSRWYHDPPVEVLRLVVLAKDALRNEVGGNVARHLFVVRTQPTNLPIPSLATVLIGRSPFREPELERLREWARAMGFAVSYDPGRATEKGDPLLAQILDADAGSLIDSVPYDLSLVTDDRPFFFDRVPLVPWALHRLGLPARSAGRGRLTTGGQTLLASLVVALAATMVLVLLPVAPRLRGRAGGTGSAVPLGRAAWWIVFFLGIGLGYITVEIVAIHRLNLYLGNPTYALAVVLATLLAGSGVGSLAGGRWLTRWSPAVTAWWVLVALVVYHVGFPPAMNATLGGSAAAKIAVSVATIAPVAFLMGLPFPRGLRAVAGISARMVSWSWAVNAAASVFGSVCAVLVSMTAGFGAAMLVGIGAYGLALLAAQMAALTRR